MADESPRQFDLSRYLPPGDGRAARRRGVLSRLSAGSLIFTSGVCFAVVLQWFLESSSMFPDDHEIDGRIVTEVAEIVSKNYVDEAKYRALLENALKGLMNLDGYSQYISPKEYPRFLENTEGEYVGIGVLVEPGETYLRITGVIPDGPAREAGVEPGDVVVRVECLAGEPSRREIPLAKRLNGPEGSAVRLWLAAPEAADALNAGGHPSEFEESARVIEVVRAPVVVPSVVVSGLLERDPAIGYIRISQFQGNTAGEIGTALELLDEGGELAGLVIDLRDNPGGVFRAAIDVAGLFLDAGDPVVTTRGRANEDTISEVHRVTRDGRWRRLPLALLIDRGTASAAEIVAGAIQDHGRGVVFGETSFGKGRVQTIYSIRRRPELYGLIKLTTQRFFTPSGRAIDGHRTDDGDPEPDDGSVRGGIEPDVALDAGDDGFAAELVNHFRDRSLDVWRAGEWPTSAASYEAFEWISPDTGTVVRDEVLVRAQACLSDPELYQGILASSIESRKHAGLEDVGETDADPRY